MRQARYTTQNKMLGLSNTITSHYNNYCTDSSTSPGNYRYQLPFSSLVPRIPKFIEGWQKTVQIDQVASLQLQQQQQQQQQQQ
jgi:hypothetical protein